MARGMIGASHTPATAGPFDRGLRILALGGIYGALAAQLVALPDYAVYPYVFLKTLLLQAIIALTIPAFLVLMWRQPGCRPRRSWVAIALGVYFLALALACAFSFNRYRSFWGAQARMTGLFSLAHYFAWYLMASSILRTWRDWRRLLHFQVALGAFAAVTALYDLRDPTIGRIFGVLGNPIYCATYQLFTLGILALLWTRGASHGARRVYAIVAVVSLVTFLLTGSRGPLVGLFTGLTLVGVLWAIASHRWRHLLGLVGGLSLAGGAYALAVRAGVSWIRHPGLQHLFANNPHEIRPWLWSMSLSGLRERPLLGWGLGNFEVVVDAHYLPGVLGNASSILGLDAADSLLFEHLSTVGLLGTLAFAAVWVALVLSLRRALRQGIIEPRVVWAILGLSAAYLGQGVFITDSPGSYAMLFLLWAVGTAAGFPEFAVNPKPTAWVARPLGPAPWAMAVLQVGGILAAWHGSIQPARASHAVMESQVAIRRGGCGRMLENVRRAAAIPTPWSEDHLALVGITIGKIAERDELKYCPAWREIYDLTREKALASFGGQWKHMRMARRLAWLAFGLGVKGHDPALLDESQRLYEALIAGSPRRQLYRTQFATLLIHRGRLREADEHLREAVAADPDRGEALWMLGVLRWQHENQPREGSRLMVQAVKAKYRHELANQTEATLLARAFWAQGDLAGLRSMEQRLAAVPGGGKPFPASYLSVARVQEQAGLIPERDRLLRIAARQDPQVATRLAPLFDGRARTLAEAEGLAGQTSGDPGVTRAALVPASGQ